MMVLLLSPSHLCSSQAQSTLFLSLPVGSQLLVFQVLLGIALLFRVSTLWMMGYICSKTCIDRVYPLCLYTHTHTRTHRFYT